MSVAIKDVANGATISFRSKDPSNLVNWRGTLESLGTYRSIQGWSDPRAENERVRQVDPTVPSDVTALTYMLITVDNQSTQSEMRAFAVEWIQPGSLIEISLAKQVTITVDDPNNDPIQIVSILAEHGYACTIVAS